MDKKPDVEPTGGPEISSSDVYEAMKAIGGYLDITPEDFKDVYAAAYRHAVKRITGSVRATDIMTLDVLSVQLSTPLKEVARAMAGRGVSGLPVLEPGGKIAGIISEKDFLIHMGGATSFMEVVADCLKGEGCLAAPVRAQRAADIMSTPAITVAEDTTLADITRAFTEHGINRVPVVDREGRLKGLVSRADIVRAWRARVDAK